LTTGGEQAMPFEALRRTAYLHAAQKAEASPTFTQPRSNALRRIDVGGASHGIQRSLPSALEIFNRCPGGRGPSTEEDIGPLRPGPF